MKKLMIAALTLAVAACAPVGRFAPDERAVQREQLEKTFSDAYIQNLSMQFSDAELNYNRLLTEAGARISDGRADLLPFLRILNKSNQGFSDLTTEEIDLELSRASPFNQRFRGEIWTVLAQDAMNSGAAEIAHLYAMRAAEIFALRLAAFDDAARASLPPEAMDGLEFAVDPDGVPRLTEVQAQFLVTSRSGHRPRVAANTADPALRDIIAAQRAHALYVAGRALTNLGEDGAAMERLSEAHDVLRVLEQKGFANWLLANTLIARSEIAVRRSAAPQMIVADVEKALRLHREAAPQTIAEAILHLRSGDILMTLGRQPAAEASYLEAVEILDSLDGYIAYDRMRGYLRHLIARHVAAPSARVEADLIRAYQRVETPATASTIAQTVARFSAGTPEVAQALTDLQNARRQEARLLQRLRLLENQPRADVNLIAVTRRRLEEATTQITQAEAMLAQAAPYFERMSNLSVDIAEARSVLSPDEAVILFTFGSTDGLAIAFTRDGLAGYSIDMSTSEVAAAVAEARRLGERSSRYDMFGPEESQWVGAAEQLITASQNFYQALFGPAEPVIASADLWMIQPSEAMLSLPFAALARPGAFDPAAVGDVNSEYGDFRSVAWLGRDKALSLVMPLGALARARQTAPSQAPELFVGFGDYQSHALPPPDKPYEDYTCAEEIAAKLYLAEGEGGGLPGTGEELALIRQALNLPEDAVKTGADFTDTALSSLALRNYRVLHFATHGVLDESQSKCPSLPGLITSINQEASGDGIFDVGDILQQTLDADLVVLSACETGAGAVRGREGAPLRSTGEGLDGLARAFFGAGARALMVSHWPVGDRPTRDLMNTFYEVLSDHETSFAYAMRDARRAMLDQPFSSNPNFWASFAIVGDGGRGL